LLESRNAAAETRCRTDPPVSGLRTPDPPGSWWPRPGAVFAIVIYDRHYAPTTITPPHLAAPSAFKTAEKEKYPERDASA